jgi:hypothetical protein
VVVPGTVLPLTTVPEEEVPAPPGDDCPFELLPFDDDPDDEVPVPDVPCPDDPLEALRTFRSRASVSPANERVTAAIAKLARPRRAARRVIDRCSGLDGLGVDVILCSLLCRTTLQVSEESGPV